MTPVTPVTPARARRLRLGFRARLALVFLLVFVVAAGVLLAVEYGVVSELFDSSIASTFTEFSTAVPGDPAGPAFADEPPGDYTITVVADSQQATRDDVLGGLLFWSALALALFSVLATALAWWMTGAPVRRIRDVTALARSISERDLSQRLSLTGPHDEIRDLADTFDTMLQRLHTAFRAQGEFIANASHELRTPLATARAALEVPLLTEPMTETLRTGMQRAIRANRRSERIIDALLDLARAGERQTDGHRLVGLADSVERQISELAEAARDAGVTVTSSIGRTESVRAHPALFDVLIRNLLANAIRYNVAGGSVTVTSRRTAGAVDGVEVVVVNTGPPVTDDVADLVKPFHRGSSSRLANGRDSGSGLGLAIVCSIALEHGARVTLRPQATGGLAVAVGMPSVT